MIFTDQFYESIETVKVFNESIEIVRVFNELIEILKEFKFIKMQKYQTLKKLGQGSFGNVQKAENRETGQIVAIKRLKKKYGTWEECLQLSEVKALRKMNHPNIIKLKEVIRVVNEAYFVFQYIEKDLFKLMLDKKAKGHKLDQYQIRSITRQLVEALIYIHKQGFFHRDLKPENILISNEMTAKIIDFGIARQIRSKPPYTQYISTRWYRAPELLFKFSSYSAPVDVFALGCIVAEMYLNRPLFSGSSEMDQISKIVSILGSPCGIWPEGVKQANLRGIHLPEYGQIPLSTVIPNCPSDGVDFISECLRWEPSKRITPTQMLNHPFLTKQIIPIHQIQHNKNSNSDKIDFKMVKNEASHPKVEKMIYDKDEEFDELLNDFKNFQVNKKQKEEDDEEWY